MNEKCCGEQDCHECEPRMMGVESVWCKEEVEKLEERGRVIRQKYKEMLDCPPNTFARSLNTKDWV